MSEAAWAWLGHGRRNQSSNSAWLHHNRTWPLTLPLLPRDRQRAHKMEVTNGVAWVRLGHRPKTSHGDRRFRSGELRHPVVFETPTSRSFSTTAMYEDPCPSMNSVARQPVPIRRWRISFFETTSQFCQGVA